MVAMPDEDATQPPAAEALAERLQWRCPRCLAEVRLQPAAGEAGCASCGSDYVRRDGIWRFLPPGREVYYARFIKEYETVRKAEGRVGNGDFYRALPSVDPTHRFHRQWSIRSRSFEHLLRHAVAPLETGQPLQILDLGAGNCWLSNRLAERGHLVAAVDISVGEGDGLGCFQHYFTSFLPVQAEFERLPWPARQFDLAIFNASLHYSCDLEQTLTEALGVLRRGGILAVTDTPIYRHPSSGAQMVRERENEFTRRFGFPSNALPMENFLTKQRLQELATSLSVRWELHRPRYGWRWSLRPWRARLTGRREPARFMLILARKENE